MDQEDLFDDAVVVDDDVVVEVVVTMVDHFVVDHNMTQVIENEIEVNAIENVDETNVPCDDDGDAASVNVNVNVNDHVSFSFLIFYHF